jgi:hypothetical protein
MAVLSLQGGFRLAASPPRNYDDWFSLDPDPPTRRHWWQELWAGFTAVGKAIGNAQGYVLLTLIYFTAIMLTRLATGLCRVRLLDKVRPRAGSFYLPRPPQDTSLDEMGIQS